MIEQGMEFVRRNLADKYVKPDEREIVKARIQQQGEYQIIDKVSVTLKEVDDKYWATLHNINQDYVNIDESVVREHDRLLMDGIWAEITLRYDPTFKFRGLTRPFFIDRIKPIQLSSRGVGRAAEARAGMPGRKRRKARQIIVFAPRTDTHPANAAERRRRSCATNRERPPRGPGGKPPRACDVGRMSNAYATCDGGRRIRDRPEMAMRSSSPNVAMGPICRDVR